MAKEKKAMVLTLRLTPQEEEIVEQLKAATGQSAATKALMQAASSFLYLSDTVKQQKAELEALHLEFAEYRQIVDRYKTARDDFNSL
jgi:NADH:ubiquinone oxidoreductase subunit E